MTLSKTQEIQKLFQQAAQIKIGSAYAAGWGNLGAAASSSAEKVCRGVVSHKAQAQAVNDQTIFDLASLTKILATTSIVMCLSEAGKIDVQAPLEFYLPEDAKAHPHLRRITLQQLLSHTSGLPAWRAYYEDLKLKFNPNLPFVSTSLRKKLFFERVLSTPPEENPGVKVIYSDVGFLILGYLLEKVFSPLTLDQLAQDWAWRKLGLSLHYRPVLCDAAGAKDPSIAATEICPWRGWLQGQVHDDNAWSMGGVAAHAGVFGSLNDVLQWTVALMNEKLVSFQTLRQFFNEVTLSGIPSRRTMGFDMPSFHGSGTTADAFSNNSVGHLGFTGTSVWIDLDSGDYACLLTNRVHPSRNDLRIRNLRRKFHTIIRSNP